VRAFLTTMLLLASGSAMSCARQVEVRYVTSAPCLLAPPPVAPPEAASVVLRADGCPYAVCMTASSVAAQAQYLASMRKWASEGWACEQGRAKEVGP
jgi:hypothetical protein